MIGEYVTHKYLNKDMAIDYHIYEVSGYISSNEVNLMSLDTKTYGNMCLTDTVVKPFWLQKMDRFCWVYGNGEVISYVIEDIYYDGAKNLCVGTLCGSSLGLDGSGVYKFAKNKFLLQG